MRGTIIGLFGLLAACGSAPSHDDAAANRTTTAAADIAAANLTAVDASEAPPAAATPASGAPSSPAATPIADAGSCRTEIGAAAAARLVAQCRDASPATHPPCNAANSCAMIRDEIARSCRLFANSDPLPPSLCPASITGTTPAQPSPVAIVRRYYQAITAGDYDRAYALWSGNGRASGKSLAAFTRGFADTAATAVETGTPTEPEGAAGSLYVTVPVTVSAKTTGGADQRFQGSYVLRRVNDVPGSSADDRSWHLYSASLHPVR